MQKKCYLRIFWQTEYSKQKKNKFKKENKGERGMPKLRSTNNYIRSLPIHSHLHTTKLKNYINKSQPIKTKIEDQNPQKSEHKKNLNFIIHFENFTKLVGLVEGLMSSIITLFLWDK